VTILNGERIVIPIKNQALFWDVRPENIDPVKHKKWLIERIVQWGTLDDIRELLKLYPIETVGKVVNSSRTIDYKTKELWMTMGRGQRMYPEILPKRALEIWGVFAELGSEMGFILVGGTALALRLGHRESEDLDFFRNEHFTTTSLLNHLFEKTPNSSDLKIIFQEPKDTLHLRLNDVKLSFLFQAGHHFDSYDLWNGVRVASIEAIVALKLNAVAGRGDRKDFIDLYAVCQEVMDFEAMLERGFALLPNLNQYHVLRSLVYFQDAENTPPLRLNREYSWIEVKRYFTEKVARYLKKSNV
jgi:hypothetical protein